MKNSVLVSVIIPVFNTAQYLAEALDSAIHQTYEKLEIIIIDDGSTDDSRKICDEYARKDKRIVVVHQDNRGLSAARNIGLNLMTGEAVAFLDSDDAYHLDFLRIMVETQIREKSDLVVCRYTTHSTTGNMTRSGTEKVYPSIEQGLYDRESALQALVEKRINNHVWNKLYSASLWKDIRFPEGHVFEDIDTTFRILDKCKRTYVVDKVLCLKRIHPGSISDTYTQQNINDWILAHEHFGSFVEKNTPDVFTEGQLIQFRQDIAQNLIEYYRHYSQKKSIHNESFLDDIRNQIVEIGAKVGIGETDFRRKTFYLLICYCPWLLRSIYPAYRNARQTVKSFVKG